MNNSCLVNQNESCGQLKVQPAFYKTERKQRREMMTNYDRGGSSYIPTSTWHDSAAQRHKHTAMPMSDRTRLEVKMETSQSHARRQLAHSGAARCELRTSLRQLEVRNRD